MAQDLSEKVKEKDTALAEAQNVLQQAGPKTRREISKRVDTIVSSWARIEEDCKRVMTVLQEYLPKVCTCVGACVFVYAQYPAVYA